MKLDWQGRMIGLCEAWPQDEELLGLYAKTREQHTPLHFVPYFELTSLLGSTGELLRALRHLIQKGRPHLTEAEREAILRQLVARMRRDSGLVDTISDCLRANPTPSEKTTLTRLLRNTYGLSQEFRTWCSEQVTEQVAGTEAPQEGYDLVTGTVRPVADVLLDVLHGL